MKFYKLEEQSINKSFTEVFSLSDNRFSIFEVVLIVSNNDMQVKLESDGETILDLNMKDDDDLFEGSYVYEPKNKTLVIKMPEPYSFASSFSVSLKNTNNGNATRVLETGMVIYG